MDIALASFSRSKIKFQIGITGRDVDEMLERFAREWRASQIGMKNYAGCINNFPERIAKRASQLALDRFGNAIYGKLGSIFVEAAFADFPSKAIENGADRVSSSGAALAFE